MANYDDVRAAAKAFVESLERMTAKEREQVPTADYAESFNRLLAMAKEALPNGDARALPAPIRIDQDGFMVQVFARYVEIETYARMILAHFPKKLAFG